MQVGLLCIRVSIILEGLQPTSGSIIILATRIVLYSRDWDTKPKVSKLYTIHGTVSSRELHRMDFLNYFIRIS
jgi:hypothetical protein